MRSSWSGHGLCFLRDGLFLNLKLFMLLRLGYGLKYYDQKYSDHFYGVKVSEATQMVKSPLKKPLFSARPRIISRLTLKRRKTSLKWFPFDTSFLKLSVIETPKKLLKSKKNPTLSWHDF